jgi:cell division initiation protein
MRITPLDLRNHRFPRRMGGYDREEVDSFLQVAAEDYEAALRRVEQQAARIRELEQRVLDLSANEKVVQETLSTVHRLSEDLKRTAIKEAEVIVGEAEIRGEKVLEAAHRRAAKLADDIREMKVLKIRLSAAVRSTIETHLELLETLATEPAVEVPPPAARIAPLPRPALAPAPAPAAAAPAAPPRAPKP